MLQIAASADDQDEVTIVLKPSSPKNHDLLWRGTRKVLPGCDGSSASPKERRSIFGIVSALLPKTGALGLPKKSLTGGEAIETTTGHDSPTVRRCIEGLDFSRCKNVIQVDGVDPPPDCAWSQFLLTTLVLKPTTVSDFHIERFFEIGLAGATIGSGKDNTVCLPSDIDIAPFKHAQLSYHTRVVVDESVEVNGERSMRGERQGVWGELSGGGLEGGGEREEDITEAIDGVSNTKARGEIEQSQQQKQKQKQEEGVDKARGKKRCSRGEGFFLSDGGLGRDFATAVRIQEGSDDRDWPLLQGSCFSVGLTVIRAHRSCPQSYAAALHPNDATATAGEEGCSELASGSNAMGNGDLCAQGLEGGSSIEVGVLWLEALVGCAKGTVWKLSEKDGMQTLGRASENDITIIDSEMSRIHSKIEYQNSPDMFFLHDAGSLNGTYIQLVGPYAAAPHPISLGDHLLVGRTGLSVNRYDYGICEKIGERPSMEDKTTVIQDLHVPGLTGSLLWPQTFAAVYDGHGGGEASEYLWANLHKKIAESLAGQAPQLIAAAERATVAAKFSAVAAAAAEAAAEAAAVAAAAAAEPTRSKSVGLTGRVFDPRLPRKLWKNCARNGVGSLSGLFSVSSDVRGKEKSKDRVGEVDKDGPWGELDSIVTSAIMDAFLTADREFLTTSPRPEAGSTATTCLILGERMYVANTGDSRTISSRKSKPRLISDDHKPNRPDEKNRIYKEQGCIFESRIMGELAVSRAFGDAEFKKTEHQMHKWKRGGEGTTDHSPWGPHPNGKLEGSVDVDAMQLVIADPEFLVSEVTAADNFVLLGCDGLFDVMNNDEVVRIVNEEMILHGNAQRCCETLSEFAIIERMSSDNVSIILLVLNRWYSAF